MSAAGHPAPSIATAAPPVATPVYKQELPTCWQPALPDAIASFTDLEDIVGSSTGCRIVPAFQGGRAVGFKVFGIRVEDNLARAGVLNGDVVTCLNGHSLDSPDSAQEAWTILSAPGRARVTFTRLQETRTVDFLHP